MSEQHLEITEAEIATLVRQVERLEAENAGYRKDIETLYHANVKLREALDIGRGEKLVHEKERLRLALKCDELKAELDIYKG